VVGPERRVVELHGGLSFEQRRLALDAFDRGAADLLLATDAGSEGINLQSRCRLVINLELPWNPMRLEQRIGRVDRIGQSKTVHVINLFAAETPEASVLARLNRRLISIRASEIEIAACIIDNGDVAAMTTRATAGHPANSAADSPTREAAEQESRRLRQLKTFGPLPAGRPAVKRPLVCVTRTRDSHSAAIWFLRGRIVNGAGLLIEDTLVPLLMPVAGENGRSRDLIDALSKRFLDVVTEAATEHLRRRARLIASDGGAWIMRAAIRERQISANVTPQAGLLQDGLFDHRLRREREKTSAQQRDLSVEFAARLNDLERHSVLLVPQPPSLEFLFLKC
jgi:hypothetical protein